MNVPASGESRVGRYDWSALASALDERGCAVLEKLLSPKECKEIAAFFSREELFFSDFLFEVDESGFDFSSFFDFESDSPFDSESLFEPDSLFEPLSSLEPESPLEEEAAEGFLA